MKRTKTYPGHVKPVRVGVYERDYQGNWRYCYWDGDLWYVNAKSVGFAYAWRLVEAGVSPIQSIPWRGLTKDHSKDQA